MFVLVLVIYTNYYCFLFLLFVYSHLCLFFDAAVCSTEVVCVVCCFDTSDMGLC